MRDRIDVGNIGILKGPLPQTNLIYYLNTTSKWNNGGRNFDVIYFDLTKAFDKVDHARVIAKLIGVGIDRKVLGIDQGLAGPETTKVGGGSIVFRMEVVTRHGKFSHHL